MTYKSDKTTVTDIDRYAESPVLSGTRVEQLTPGLFQSTTEHVRTEKIFIYRQHWTHGMRAQSTCPHGHFLIGGNITAETQLIWRGVDLCPTNLFFARSSDALDYIMPTGSKHTVLIVPNDILETCLNGNDPLKNVQSPNMLTCDLQLRSSFINRINLLISHCLSDFDDKTLLKEKTSKLIDAEMMNMLSHLLIDPETKFGRLNANRSKAVLQRAIAYIEHIKDPISVSEVATAANVSQRTLVYTFRKYLNITPVRYMIMRRLHGAHRDLRHADPESTTVSKCGINWGFSQLGRMAVEYHRLFGESPSTTLNQRYYNTGYNLFDG